MDKLLITSKVLDVLGFSEYWDMHGTSGTRTLKLPDGGVIILVEIDETPDDSDGYSLEGEYVSNHYRHAPWVYPEKFKQPYGPEKPVYFLHDLYEIVKEHHKSCLEWFIDRCRENKMGKYIKRYLEGLEPGKSLNNY